MLNYIRSEIYRNLRSKGNYRFIGGAMAFVVLLNVILGMFLKMDAAFPYGNTKFAFSSLYASLAFPLMLCIAIASLAFGQEYKNSTLKNSVSFGISRSSIYFSKFLMSIILSVISIVCISFAFIISAYALLENSGVEYLNILISSLMSCAPLFLVSLTVAHCFYFIVDTEMNVIGFWVMIVAVIPQLLSMAGRRSEICKTIASYTPWVMVSDVTFSEVTNELVLGWSTPGGLLKCIIVGIVGSAVFYMIGLELFKKKEIK
ncbi:ABC transporter permease [Clostridium sp.]|uniref:ABC transporter permease n=1 Tax=Clostridium sp. TaxID=1506 RepID=UPI003216AC9F